MTNLPKRRNAEPPVKPPIDAVEQVPDSLKVNPTELLAQMLKVEMRSEEYQGPLPHPDTLRQFNEVLPGLADRIIRQWELQSAHRRGIEERAIQADITRAYLGLAAGYTVTIAFLVVAALLVVYGYAIPGTIIGTVDLVALASIFVYSNEDRRRERDRKARLMNNPNAKPKKQSKGRKVS